MSADIATQPHKLPLAVTEEICAGSTYIVTGANVGLGLEAAKHLVALKSKRVILAVRNVTAGEEAKAQIEKETGNKGIAEVWKLDMSSYTSVKEFAEKAKTELERIDAVIENAAVAAVAPDAPATAEGHVTQLTVNVFSTLLLAMLLLPKMSSDAKQFGITPHVTIITSRVGFDEMDNWNKTKDDPVTKLDTDEEIKARAYSISKLILSMACLHFLPLIPVSQTGVVVNITCPGFCVTTLARHAPAAFKEQITKMHAQFGRTAEDGSRTLLYGAVAGKESHGQLLDSCRVADEKIPTWAKDEEGQKYQKVAWEAVAKELEAIEPDCLKQVLEL